MTKVYSTKSNAIRGFKSTHPEVANGLDNAQIASHFLINTGEKAWVIDGDEVTKWVAANSVKVVKRHILKGVQFRRRSVEPEGITSMVHEMFNDYIAEAEEAEKPTPTRKQMIARAVRDGVAYYTARTQYQKWFKG